MPKIKKLDSPLKIPDERIVRLVTMGNQYMVESLERPPKEFPVLRISKDEFMVLSTGEVFQYSAAHDKSESLQSVRRVLQNIRALINTNVVNPAFCRWVTLTYRDNMRDTVQLYSDFDSFRKRFYRYCLKHDFGKPEYISVVEPQARGAWHVHAFLIWDSLAPFIPNSDLEKLWSHGFTKITALNHCDNIGAYFSAYLADMPLDDVQSVSDKRLRDSLYRCPIEQKEFIDSKETVKKKKFIKGGRLYFYPLHMRICRHSKGIKQPIIEDLPYFWAKEKISSAKLTFSSSCSVVSDDADCSLNVITKEYYNGNL